MDSPRFRRLLPFALIALVLVPTVIALIRAIHTGEELATTVLTVPVLALTAVILWYTVPSPAKLILVRQDELELVDLIFYVYPKPNPNNKRQVPRDYLFQLHVAVCNIGGRKAVLSRVRIEGFRDDQGRTLKLPDAPTWIDGAQTRQQSEWVDGHRVFRTVTESMPYVLERDDVITIRFRARRAVDWGPNTTLEKIKEFYDALERPFSNAFGHYVWRRGDDVVSSRFEVPVTAIQQDLYRERIRELTEDFSTLPEVEQVATPIE